MKRRIFKTGLLALASLAMLWGAVGCDINDDVNEKKASIQIKLTDAPALNYDEVNVDIRGVSVAPAMWDLTVVADESTSYVDEAIDDIVVKVGEVVDLGVIELDVIE